MLDRWMKGGQSFIYIIVLNEMSHEYQCIIVMNVRSTDYLLFPSSIQLMIVVIYNKPKLFTRVSEFINNGLYKIIKTTLT